MKNLPLLVTHLFFCNLTKPEQPSCRFSWLFHQHWWTSSRQHRTPVPRHHRRVAGSVHLQLGGLQPGELYTHVGVSFNGGPQNTPKWSFVVGKPMVVGYHHLRKHPCIPDPCEDILCIPSSWYPFHGQTLSIYTLNLANRYPGSLPLWVSWVMPCIAADSHKRCSFYLSICSGASSIDQNRTASPKMVKFDQEKKTTSDDSDLTFWSNIFCGN